MDKNNNDLHFTCTNCGKCCNGSPQMSLNDAFKLSSEFVFTLGFNIFDLNTEYEHDKEFGFKISNPLYNVGEKRFFYELCIDPLDLKEGKCNKLIDNKCSIPNKKPTICNMMPFKFVYGQKKEGLSKALKRFDFINNSECDFSENANLIWSDGGYAGNYQGFYLKAIKDRDIEFKILALMTNAARKDKNLMRLIKSFKGNKDAPLLSPIELYKYLIKLKLYSKEELCNFAINQIELIDSILKNIKLEHNKELDLIYLKDTNNNILNMIKNINVT